MFFDETVASFVSCLVMTVLAENLTITLPAAASNDANEHSNHSPITMASFGCADKPAEKHCWLICCERKTLLRLKNKLKKTDYKSDEQPNF
jgi:hypothetical protein